MNLLHINLQIYKFPILNVSNDFIEELFYQHSIISFKELFKCSMNF